MSKRVGDVSEITDGTMRAFDLDGSKVTVASVGGRLYAFDDACTHRGCSLAGGTLVGVTVTCPCHGGQFDATSGAVLRGPATRPLRSRGVEVSGTDVLVET